MKIKVLENDIRIVNENLNTVRTRDTRTKRQKELSEWKIQQLQEELGLRDSELIRIEENHDMVDSEEEAQATEDAKPREGKAQRDSKLKCQMSLGTEIIYA